MQKRAVFDAPDGSLDQTVTLSAVTSSDAWLRTIYSDLWQQTSYEAQLVASRANLFLTVQAALLAVLVAGSGSVVKAGCIRLLHAGIQMHFGLMLLGSLWALVALLLLVLGHFFTRVSRAGTRYAYLRLAHIRVIEEMTVGKFGPAHVEADWRERSKHSQRRFNILEQFRDVAANGDLSIFAYNNFGMYKFLRATSGVWNAIYVCLFVFGVFCLVLGSRPGIMEMWGVYAPWLECGGNH